MFLYGHPFNFQLMAWTENRKARKWECFQNVVFSLQCIYKSCKKKKILRSPTPAFLEHWERNYSFLCSYPYFFLPPKSSLLLLCSISVILKADNSHHLPNREAGNQESFGVSSVGQCRRMEGSLSFSSCFWLNCSRWCNVSNTHWRFLSDHKTSHPTGMAQHQHSNEITTGNPERETDGTRKWLYLTAQTVLLPELGMKINHFLLSETKGFNTFQISSCGGKGSQKGQCLGGA